MNTPDERVVKSLTKGERDAIRNAFWSSVFGKWHVPLTTNRRVGAGLFAKGLMLKPPGWKLNAKGERIRQALTPRS